MWLVVLVSALTEVAATTHEPAISRVPQKSSNAARCSAAGSGAPRPRSSRSRAWKTKASASVKALLGTPCSSVWSMVVMEKTCSTLWPISWTAML